MKKELDAKLKAAESKFVKLGEEILELNRQLETIKNERIKLQGEFRCLSGLKDELVENEKTETCDKSEVSVDEPCETSNESKV